VQLDTAHHRSPGSGGGTAGERAAGRSGPAPSERITVAFEGEGAGIDELSWGQKEIYLAMIRQERWLWLGGTLPLAPGRTVQDVADELRYLMSRFPSMRTLLRFDEDGHPTQELFASGEVVLEVYDAEGGDGEGGADLVAAAVSSRYQDAGRDFTRDWPVRMAVVRQRGVPVRLVVITCHLVMDGAGALLLSREVEARETAPATGMQQLEQARWQRSAAGQRQNAAALRHVEKVLRSLPARPSPVSADRREPRHWSGEFRSRALRLAVQAIAERTRADSSAVLLALFAIAVGRATGFNPVVVRPVSHNRFRPGLADVVCMIAQAGICALDLADITVDEAVGRTQRATTTAFKHAYFDPEDLSALVRRLAAEQGPEFGVSCFFNDRRADRRLAADGAITEERVRDALASSTFHWFEKKDNPYEPLFLHVEDSEDSIRLSVCADTHCFSPAGNEALARDMEAIAVAAAFDPAVPTRVPA
jgi:hypothetical protein